MVNKILQWIILIAAVVLAYLGFRRAQDISAKAQQALDDIKKREAQLQAEKEKLKQTQDALAKTSAEADAEIFDREK